MAAGASLRTFKPHAIFNEEGLNIPFKGQCLAAVLKLVSFRSAGLYPGSNQAQCVQVTPVLVQLSFNPISALTHATLDVLCSDPGTRGVARAMMLEAQAIAETLGVTFPIDVERRIDGGAAVGAHRTSMLQDLDAGRPMEIDALVGSVRELGRVTGTPTPAIDTVLALLALRGPLAGLYDGPAGTADTAAGTVVPLAKAG